MGNGMIKFAQTVFNIFGILISLMEAKMRNLLTAIILTGAILLSSCENFSQSLRENKISPANKTELIVSTTPSLYSNAELRNTPQVRSINFISAKEIWFIKGLTREIIFTNDGGANWSTDVPPEISSAFAIDFINDLLGWLVDTNGNIWRTNNGGKTWLKEFSSKGKSGNDLNYIGTSQIEFQSAKRGWILNDSAYLTNDGGLSWRRVSSFQGEPRKMFSTDNLHTWVIAEQGDEVNTWVNRTSDGGQNWEAIKIVKGYSPQDIFFLDNNNGWVSSSQGKLFRTVNGGKNWELQKTVAGDFETESIFWLNSKEGWLAGYILKDKPEFMRDGKASLLKTSDGGQTWIKVEFENDDPFFSKIYFENTLNGWVIGRDNIYKTIDGGKTWKVVLALTNRS
jgi:photosystem II stability/assembly factor-like uncharacterized protein